ncbi:MAG: hypothetical protein N3H31_03755 [Candidatus Nezhaarchaeota archaeon]|nr:hypothetical protein [Candidatus Nezhaarchaeota archaeon]
MEIEWSKEGCRWLVKRLGPALIYVELSIIASHGRPALKRSLVLYDNRGRREVFAEVYGLEEALELRRAEGALLSRLLLYPLSPRPLTNPIGEA